MVRFLDGKNRRVLQDLRREMEAAAENLEFERAADLRDRMRAAEQVIEQEKVGYSTLTDQDMHRASRATRAHACVQMFFMRGGQLARRDAYFMLRTPRARPTAQSVTASSSSSTARRRTIPDELVLPDELDEAEDDRGMAARG